MKRSILYILLFVLLFSACDNKDYWQGMLSANDKISIDKVEFHPTGGVVTFCITANDRWSVQGCTNGTFKKWPWLSISNSVGNKGTSKVTLTAGPATTDVKSEIEFEIDGEYLSIPLLQEKPFLKASVSDQSKIRLEKDDDTGKYKANFEWYHGKDVVDYESLDIVIDSNTDWKVVSVNDANSEEAFENIEWLSCSQKKSESEKTEDNPITFIPETYNSGGKKGVRTATFRIVGYDDAKGNFGNVHTFTVTQPGLRFSVDEPTCENKDQAITSLPPCNVSPINMTVDSEVDWFWSVSDVLNQKDEVKNVDENNPTKVTITIPTNPTRKPRTFDVTVTPKTGEFKDGKEIRPSIEKFLTQRAYDLEFLGHANYIYNHGKLGNDDTGEQKAQLKSSGAWQIDESTIPDWLNVSSSLSGKGFVYGDPETVDVAFNAKTRNYDDQEDCSATVVVKSVEEGNTLETSLSVSQAKYVLSQPPVDLWLNCTANSSESLKFNSTGEWRLETVDYKEGEKDWLEFSKNSSFNDAVDELTGEGNATVYYRANRANVSVDTDNVAHVRLVSVTHEKGRENQETDKELYRDFSITQRKFVFQITPDNEYDESEGGFVYKAVPGNNIHYVDIDTSADWEFDNSGFTWIKEHEARNNGVIRFYITVDKNLNVGSRDGRFTIRSKHDPTKIESFDVHQEGYVWSVSPVAFNKFDAVDVEAQTITVNCSGTWRITNLNADAEAMISNWRTLSNNSQTSGKALFEISNNYELQDREAEFTIQSDDDSKFRQKITFKQEAFEFEVRRETGNLEFDALEPKSVTFNINISGEGLEYFDMDGLKTQLSKSGWFKVDEEKYFKVGGKKITITPLENYQLEPNRLDLVFGSNGGHTPPFTLTQEAFEFDKEAGELSFDASLTQQSREFQLESSTGDWSVIKDKNTDWIKEVYPEGGSAPGRIRVTVAPHYTTDATVKEREGKIYVESVYVESNNKLSKQMTIKQSVYKLVVDNNKTDVPLLKDKDATESIPVTCSGEWDFQVTKGSEFIKAEKEDSTLVITALSTNSAVEERKATITLFTKNYTDTFTPLTLNITVTQEGTPKK